MGRGCGVWAFMTMGSRHTATTSSASISTEAPWRMRLTVMTRRALGAFRIRNPRRALEGAAPYLDRHPRLQERVRINGEGAGDQASHSLDLSLGDRHAVTAHSRHLYDTSSTQYSHRILPGEACEAITGEQWELDLHRTVLPLAPSIDEPKKRFDALAINLSPHSFLMPGAGAERVPLGYRHHRSLQPQLRPLIMGSIS